MEPTTNSFVDIPILEYSSVVANELDDMSNCTSAAKFERDLRELKMNGYESLSLHDYIAIRQGEKSCPEKSFVLVLIGGYEDNYTVAFPILHRMQVKASIFIATELVGLRSHPRVEKMAPHFGWSEAQEMIDSGLLHIYPMWHVFDNGKNFEEEVKNKLALLKSKLRNNGPLIAFAHRICNRDTQNILNSLDVEVNLTDYDRVNLDLVEIGAAPTVDVGFNASVLDQVDWHHVAHDDLIFKSGKTMSEDLLLIQSCCAMPAASVLEESVELPIDPKPRVRNYLRHAFPLAILQTDRIEKVNRLLLTDFIDLVYLPSYEWLDYHNDSYEAWGLFACRQMDSDLLIANGLNVIAYIINGLKAGYYCEIWLDTFYIRGKPGYRMQHKTHGLLLYGYDAEHRAFHGYSYTAWGTYDKLITPIDEIAQGCSTPYFDVMNFIKIQHGKTVEYNFRAVCSRLRDYIQSVCHDDNHRYVTYGSGQSVQYDASLQFVRHIEQKMNEKGMLPEIPIYTFGEHKSLMTWRLCLLAEREEISMPELNTVYKRTEKTSQWLINASLKYNMRPNEELAGAIIRTMNELNEQEKRLLEEFLEKASHKLDKT